MLPAIAAMVCALSANGSRRRPGFPSYDDAVAARARFERRGLQMRVRDGADCFTLTRALHSAPVLRVRRAEWEAGQHFLVDKAPARVYRAEGRYAAGADPSAGHGCALTPDQRDLADDFADALSAPRARGGAPSDAPGAAPLERNNTSYPVKLTAKIRELHREYLALLAAGAQGDAPGGGALVAAALKYYQFLARQVMSGPGYGIATAVRAPSAPDGGNGRGLLVYHAMGMGKTRLGVGVAMALADRFAPVVILPKSLQKNFKDTVRTFAHATAGESVPEDRRAELGESALRRFRFVALDAYNMVAQVARATAGVGGTGSLDNRLLIVDEAHNFFRAIINSAGTETNARKLYDMVMAAKNLKILFLTGTPASKNPFELVPCFNMLAGYELLPEQFDQFYKLYVNDAKSGIRAETRGRLANRLVGLVTHVSPALPSEPGGRPMAEAFDAPDDVRRGGYPTKLPLIVERVEMSPDQYRTYLLAREKEENEGKGSGGGRKPAGERPAPPLALPGSESGKGSTYYVKSRTLGNFAAPTEYERATLAEMPDDAFTAETGPKVAKMVENIEKSQGPVLVYSQFVGAGGLAVVARFLRVAGYTEYTPPASLLARAKAGLKAQHAAAAFGAGAPHREVPEAELEYMRGCARMVSGLPGYPLAPGDLEGAAEQALLDWLKRSADAYNDPSGKLSVAQWAFLECIVKRGRHFFHGDKPYPEETEEVGELEPRLMARLHPARSVEWGKRVINEYLDPQSALEFDTEEWEFLAKVFYANSPRAETSPEVTGGGVVEIHVYDEPSDIPEALQDEIEAHAMPIDTLPSNAQTLVALSQSGDFEGICQVISSSHSAVADHYGGMCTDSKVLGNLFVKAGARQRGVGRELVAEAKKFGAACLMVASDNAPALALYKKLGFREQSRGEGDGKTWLEMRIAAEGGAEAAAAAPKEETHAYAIISGEVPPEERAAIAMAFNERANVHGAVIKALLVSKTGAEGLDLKNARQVHKLEPYWDKSREDQVDARVVRLGSHDALPAAEREVQPFLYLAVANERMYRGMQPTEEEGKKSLAVYKLIETQTIDEKFHERALKTAALNEEFRTLLREVCIECAANGYENCRMCVPTNAQLFHANAIRDLRFPDPCDTLVEQEVDVKPLALDGETYYYRGDPGDPDGAEFFEWDPALDAYAPVDPSSGLYVSLHEALSALGEK